LRGTGALPTREPTAEPTAKAEDGRARVPAPTAAPVHTPDAPTASQ